MKVFWWQTALHIEPETVTALESVGIEVDPRNQTMKRLPATRLKGLQRRVHTSHMVDISG